MRWIFTSVILFSFTGLGLYRAQASELRFRTLEKLCLFMRTFLQVLESTRGDLDDVLRQTRRRCGLPELSGESDPFGRGLEGEERSCLSAFLRGLEARSWRSRGPTALPASRRGSGCLSAAAPRLGKSAG